MLEEALRLSGKPALELCFSPHGNRMEFLVVLCAQPQGECAGCIPRGCVLSEKSEVWGVIPDDPCEQPPPLSEVTDLYKGPTSCI